MLHAHCFGQPIIEACAISSLLRSEFSTTTANGATDLPASVTERGSFEDVPVTYLPRSFPKRDFRSAALDAALDAVADGCDVVHVHGCWNFFGWEAARWCWRRGVPYVLSPRGMLYPWSFRQGRWIRKWLSYRNKALRTRLA